MQLKLKGCTLQRAVGYWAFALLCGSAVVACSGTIDTPSGENPAPQAEDDDDAPTTPVRPPANTNTDPEPEPEPAPIDNDPPPEDPADDPAEQAPAPSGNLSFEADVWPIFQDSCGPCHVSLGSGGQNIGADDLAEAFADSVDFEDEVIEEIASGGMPLGCNAPPGGGGACVSAEDFETIESWYAAGAPE